MNNNYVGSGIIFPIELTPAGFPITRSGSILINSSIEMILSTSLRSRIFLSEFGSLIDRLIGEPNDDLLQGLVEHYIDDTLTKWEPRIRVLEVSSSRLQSEKLDVSIRYEEKASGLEQVLTFPFYKKIIY